MFKRENLFLLVVVAIVTLGGLLFGFDMAVISGAIPLVQEQFELTATLEGWFVSSALLGAVLGVAASGELSDRFGRKRLLISSGLLFSLSAFGCAFAPSFSYLVIARITGGVAVGVASNITPLYISEVAPAKIRGALVTCYQLAITVGILLAYLSNVWILQLSEALEPASSGYIIQYLFLEDSWRAMFGIELIPAVIFSTGLLFVPESPRWLFENDSEQQAEEILNRFLTPSALQKEVQSIKKAITKEVKTLYKDLLRPGLRKALFIGIMLPLLSQFSGINAVIYYGPRILNSAGFDIDSAMTSQIYLGIANMLFTFIAIWYVDKKGRRPLYIYGTLGATISLFFTGLCFYFDAVGSIFLVFSVITFLGCFAFSIGPLKFVVTSEIFPNQIRGRALALCTLTMWIADMVLGQVTPVLLETVEASGTFWLFSAICLISFLFVYKYVPETKDKTLEDIQEMWSDEESRMEITSDIFKN